MLFISSTYRDTVSIKENWKEGETETITEKIYEAFFMFKVLGWGGWCGGRVSEVWDWDFRIGLRLVQFNFDILLNSDK